MAWNRSGKVSASSQPFGVEAYSSSSQTWGVATAPALDTPPAPQPNPPLQQATTSHHQSPPEGQVRVWGVASVKAAESDTEHTWTLLCNY